MKIGIITFHNADNYGAVLQNYALQQAILQMNHEPITINYRRRDSQKKKPTGNTGAHPVLERGLHLLFHTINLEATLRRKRRFESFRSEHLRLSPEKDQNDLQSDAREYDIYITGSDQVWNTRMIGGDFHSYALGFVADRPKASYGASSGTSMISDTRLMEFIKALDYVTVRESSLCDYLRNQGICSNTVCDPVLLLEQAHWKKMIENVPAHTQGKVFCYVIDDEIYPVCCKIAQDVASGRRVCSPAPICKKLLRYHQKSVRSDGPLEFLADLNASDVVVTSSFHAVAFCILFEKDFIAVPYGSKGQRLTDLLELAGLQDRSFLSYEEFCKRGAMGEIDYEPVRQKISELRRASRKELEHICSLKEHISK